MLAYKAIEIAKQFSYGEEIEGPETRRRVKTNPLKLTLVFFCSLKETKPLHGSKAVQVLIC